MSQNSALGPVETIAVAAKSTREDWINVALDILIRDGIDSVKVQVISKKLGV